MDRDELLYLLRCEIEHRKDIKTNTFDLREDTYQNGYINGLEYAIKTVNEMKDDMPKLLETISALEKERRRLSNIIYDTVL